MYRCRSRLVVGWYKCDNSIMSLCVVCACLFMGYVSFCGVDESCTVLFQVESSCLLHTRPVGL